MNRPLGYQALIKHFHLKIVPPFCTPRIDRKSSALNPFDHLLFAIKYEGIHLGILKKIFLCMPKKEIEHFITQQVPTEAGRKIWYLYELLTGFHCAIPHMKSGAYKELVDSRKYYTGRHKKSARHRIIDNLLGTVAFCPTVRKTQLLQALEKKGLQQRAKKLIKYRHKGSIVHTAPPLNGEKRHKRFLKLIEEAPHIPDLTKKTLISLHNKAVGYGFAESTFRKHQNYLSYEDGTICRISPQPKDVPSLMEGLFDCYHRTTSLHPVIRAAIISFGFSIIHPFGDGNGRVQLFLLYYLLFHSPFQSFAKLFSPDLEHFFYLPGFNASIEQFDKVLSSLVQHTLHKNETLTVHGETVDLYRYIDFTPMAEFLFTTIDKKLKNILNS